MATNCQLSFPSAFATPCAVFCDELRRFLDALECNQTAHKLLHTHKGRRQLETFLMMQHGSATRFEQVLARDSLVWKNYVDLAKTIKNVRVQERPVLYDLLPGLQHVYDIRVGRPGKPDDAVYLEDEYARKWLPRGNCIAEWTNSGTTYFFPLVRGFRKFTGQEDDGELAKQVKKKKKNNGQLANDAAKEAEEAKLSKFFTKPQSQSKWVISTTKENGETGHLGVLKRRDGEFIYVLGSKNTHLMAQTVDDVTMSRTQQQSDDGNDAFCAAAPIAIAILQMLFALEAAKRQLLNDFLWQTRATACFEVLCPNHQHVQLLDHLSGDTPVFYGLSLMTLNPLEGAEMCVNPVLLYEFMHALGVRTVAYEIVRVDGGGIEAELDRSKNAYQVEGCVHLFLDDDAAVIGMQKLKSIWYVCLRAIREKAKTFCRTVESAKPPKGRAGPFLPKEALKLGMESIHKRFQAIQRFLQISSEVSDAYEALGKQFLDYLFHHELFLGHASKRDQEKTRKLVATSVSDQFPVVWKRFLNHTGLSDVIDNRHSKIECTPLILARNHINSRN